MPIGRRARIALRWTAVLGAVASGSALLLGLYGVALIDRAMTAASKPSGMRLLASPLRLAPGDPWTEAELLAALRRRALPERPGGLQPRAGEFVRSGEQFLFHPSLVKGASGTVVVRVTAGRLVVEPGGGTHAGGLLIRETIVSTTAPAGVVRWPVSLERMSPHLLTAVVDIEDRTFLSHPGLSLRGILRAAVRDAKSRAVREGGSTLTQQLAKILLLRPSRTVSRKLAEGWLAPLLELRYDKSDILGTYLNRVYIGQDGGWEIHGVEAGSWYYFGKSAAEIEVDEAALLAGLIAAPNRFDPFTSPDAAGRRRDAVLEAMRREGHLTAAEAEAASAQPLPAAPRRLRWPAAAHFVDAVRPVLDRQGAHRLTLDVDVQEAVRSGVAAGLAELEARHFRLRELERLDDPVQAAVVVITASGEILALQGSRTGRPGEFVRATAARRQVGSLVKPLLVGTALSRGMSLDQLLIDAPLTLSLGDGSWSPTNSDGTFAGEVTMREALVHSRNVPIVRLGMQLGLDPFIERLQRHGFRRVPRAPAILLGALEATPIEVARAYLPFVAKGRMPEVAFSRDRREAPSWVMEEAVAAEVAAALGEVVRRGTAAGTAGPGEPLAGKTGTTDGRRDSWFVALRPRLVTVVWIGTDGNRETGLFGATGALAVWREIDRRIPRVWKLPDRS
ncbi:MAG: transglycosylase domain-containing protein [Acidobacteriota bacterium]